MPRNATREKLLAYQTLLHRRHNRLIALEEQLDARKAVADASSARRAAESSHRDTASQNHSASGPHAAAPKRRSRTTHLTDAEQAGTKKKLDIETSQLTMDAEGNLIAKTPQVAIVAARVYLQSIQPPEGDPRAKLHNSTIAGLGLIVSALETGKASAAHTPKTAEPASGKQAKEDPPRRSRSPRKIIKT